MKWKSLTQVHDALSLTANARHETSTIIHDPKRSEMAPEVPATIPQPQQVMKGLLVPETQPQMPTLLRSSPSLSQGPLPIRAGTLDLVPKLPNDSTTVQSKPLNLQTQTIQLVARQKVMQTAQLRQPSPRNQPRTQRKDRTCRKCAVSGCPGRKQVTLCLNMCQDCGKINCQGRNPKRPKKACSEGWVGVDD